MDPLFALTVHVADAVVRLRRVRSQFDLEDPPWIVRERLEPLSQSLVAVDKTLEDIGVSFRTSIGDLPPASTEQDVEAALVSVKAASVFADRASDVLRERRPSSTRLGDSG